MGAKTGVGDSNKTMSHDDNAAGVPVYLYWIEADCLWTAHTKYK